MHHQLGHRKHLDGLRAIAVLGVLFHHFGLRWLPGGFVGVDIFFVLSGFLIAKTLLNDSERGKVSLPAFYERRLRRIVPAFLFTTLLTSIAAFVILFPGPLVRYADSLLWSLFFIPNVYFYLKTDYFSPGANETPLLHLWSLGVEMQFYLVFPILVVLIRKWKQTAFAATICLLLILSLAASEAMVRLDPQAAFYLLPFRGFEFLIGTCLALPARRRPLFVAMGGLAMGTGLGMIAAAMVVLTEQSRFPGLAALLPALGAALVIWAGEQGPSLPARLLALSWLRFVGRISYSLYLVHWQVAVFLRMLNPGIDPLVFMMMGIAISLTLGWLSWHYVEQPGLGRGTFRLSGPVLATGSLLTIVGLAGAAGLARTASGFPRRFDERIAALLAESQHSHQAVFREGTCFLRQEQVPAELASDCLPKHPQRSVVLWGSSYLAQFQAGLAPLLAERGLELGQITGSACYPILDWDHPARPNCRALNDYAYRWLLANKPALVVVGGDPYAIYPGLLPRFDATVRMLIQADIRVVVLGPVATYIRPVPYILAERLREANRDVSSSHVLSDQSVQAGAAHREWYASRRDLTYVSPLEQICRAFVCELGRDGEPLYFDTAHYTLKGAKHYGPILGRLLLSALADKTTARRSWYR